jgi:hypothetical protein
VANANELVPVDASGGAVSITVPTTAGAPCLVYRVDTDTSQNTVTVVLGGGPTTTIHQPGHGRMTIGIGGGSAWAVLDRKPYGYADYLDTAVHTGATFTIAKADVGRVHEMNSGTAQSFIFPAFATVPFVDGCTLEWMQRGGGQTTFSHASGAGHLEGKGTKTNGQGAQGGARYRANGDVWILSGDLV